MRGIRVLSDIPFRDIEANRSLLSVSIQVTSPLNGSLKLRSSSSQSPPALDLITSTSMLQTRPMEVSPSLK